MPPSSSAVVDHIRRLAAVQTATVAAGRHAWSQVARGRIAESWAEHVDQLAALVTAAQRRAATLGASYTAAALAEQGEWVAPDAFVDTDQLAGWAPDGRTLQGLLRSPAVTANTMLGQGASPVQALATAGQGLSMILTTVVADTSRQAAMVDIAGRDQVGYLRMASPGCCARCAILTGRFYRWNQGFLRHPRCGCVHVPSTSRSVHAAQAEGFVTDPYEYFRSLPEKEQDRIFTAAGARAVREGADLSRVVNARRGMSTNGVFTTEGMGRRGFARQQLGPRQRRLTPEGLARMHPNRDDYLRALRQHGYLHPGGQDPLGSIKGAFYEGYGELGRGGTRVAARRAVEEARATGVRTESRYTMTAAERRVYDAQLQWKAVLAGRNPLGRGPLTPEIRAAVEGNYRRRLANAGQVFTGGEDAVQQAEKIVVRAGGGSGSGTRPPRLTSGAMDGDDREQVADAIMQAARDAEPSISAGVRAVAAEVDGTIERFGSRFKSRESVLEKLERFAKPESPRYRLERFNDALRYTVVIDDSTYWKAAQSAVASLRARGYETTAAGGWRRRGYRGLNVTVRDADGFLFEVQFHTPASLRAAESSHELYERLRRLPRTDPEWRRIQREVDAVFGSVGIPPDVPLI